MAFLYFKIYKPWGFLSQFTKEIEQHQTLADINFSFSKDIYPVGRLDKDSEGLLILTNDRKLNAKMLQSNHKVEKVYLAQVEGVPGEEALKALKGPMKIRVKKKEISTLPAEVRLLSGPPVIPEREQPVRFRKSIPTSWVQISIIEGKNHQVRKMFAGVGYPVLRLIRTGVGNIRLDDMQPGEVRELTHSQL